jgi:hypothetical protein
VEVPLALVLDVAIHHMLDVLRRGPRFHKRLLPLHDGGSWFGVVAVEGVTIWLALLVGTNGADQGPQ